MTSMTQNGVTSFQGTAYTNGVMSATLLTANLELSFWGGVNPKTGEVIDRFHPLSGCLLKDTILAIPSGGGSCGGSVIMMELILNGLGPKALIFKRREDIITLGVIVAEEFFGKTAPVVVLRPEDFDQILSWNGTTVYIHGDRVSDFPLQSSPPDHDRAIFDISSLKVQLSDFDKAALEGVNGEATRISMKILARVADMMGAQEMIDVSQAHLDGAWYGPGSLAFAKKLRDLGGRFRIPSTINSLNIDQRRWRNLGIDTELGSTCDELTQAFLDMDGKVSFTCAPYLLDTAPKLGDSIAWGESNAVIYANSVLGARTLKNPNMLEILIALTGRAPKAGVYLDENRMAELHIHVQPFRNIDSSFWPVLGYALGATASTRSPVITGLEDMKPSTTDFKAFSAAFATSSSAAMFHMVNLTPEAPTLEAVCGGDVPPQISLGWKELSDCWHEFNHSSTSRQVDLISLGNPHFTLHEIKDLAMLCRGKNKHADVAVIVTCGRAVHALASQAGYVRDLEAFGVQFLTDTCWCSIEEPIIPKKAKVIMTNSGKYIHYGPGLTGRQFCFGSLEMCAEAAMTGRNTGEPPEWLQKVNCM
ncbi:DUF521 domain-containing protein [Fusarium denticulatum]|uniref:DUF521 domain-containing protein n=1 Tax=Fusarium denticulatum TaxID=48507 RepID=A0A8H5UCV2_9HYPO|nr:DUF521 domain-containing protein [Fusarium denticulatum]